MCARAMSTAPSEYLILNGFSKLNCLGKSVCEIWSDRYSKDMFSHDETDDPYNVTFRVYIFTGCGNSRLAEQICITMDLNTSPIRTSLQMSVKMTFFS